MSITEYMTLMQALDKGLIHNIVEFYYVSRSILCKNEHHFDVYDIAFVNFFKDASLDFPEDVKQEIWDWLNKPFEADEMVQLPREFEEILSEFDLEDLQKKFEEMMKEQDEEHDGGNHFIGTGGTSRYGHSGKNPMGIKVGGGTGMKTAMQVAQKRVFKDYRKDIVLDTRQIKVALKRLRKLEEIGKRDELNMDKTINETAQNGGDIELVFEKRRKNNLKMLLIMDVGGSMTPYAHLVNLLFSAANQMSHWKDFKFYYYHNCPYDKLYFNALRKPEEAIDFEEFIIKYDKSYKCVMVGDAAMASWELTERYGSIYYYHRNEMPGIYYIRELANHFKNNIVWLNPEVVDPRWMAWTRKVIAGIIPMYNLTVDGIEEAMDFLRKSGKNHYTTVHQLRNQELTRARFS